MAMVHLIPRTRAPRAPEAGCPVGLDGIDRATCWIGEDEHGCRYWSAVLDKCCFEARQQAERERG